LQKATRRFYARRLTRVRTRDSLFFLSIRQFSVLSSRVATLRPASSRHVSSSRVGSRMLQGGRIGCRDFREVQHLDAAFGLLTSSGALFRTVKGGRQAAVHAVVIARSETTKQSLRSHTEIVTCPSGARNDAGGRSSDCRASPFVRSSVLWLRPVSHSEVSSGHKAAVISVKYAYPLS